MNIFSLIFNKLRYNEVTSIDQNKEFSLGRHKSAHDGYTLLKNSKKLADNLLWVSDNFSIYDDGTQQDYIYAKPIRGSFLIFDRNGTCLTPNGIKIYNSKRQVEKDHPITYGIDSELGEIVIENTYSKDKFILYPHKKKISRTFTEISDYNDLYHRKVRLPDNFYQYINSDGKFVSSLFLYETEEDVNGNRIQTTINSRGNEVDVIINKHHKHLSKFYDRIVPYNQAYVAVNNDGSKIFLNTDGKEIHSVNNDKKPININKGVNGITTISFAKNHKLVPAQNIICDQDLNIVLGIVDNKPQLFQADGTPHNVPYSLAEIMMKIYKGITPSEMEKFKLTRDLDSLKDTIKVFGKVISSNLKSDPQNQKLAEAYTITEERFKKILNASTTKDQADIILQS